jgi:hypothetical protein
MWRRVTRHGTVLAISLVLSAVAWAEVRAETINMDLYDDGRLRPEYDSGDHAHLNAAGTDVIVTRAVPDVERLLMQIASRPTR